MLTFLQPGAGEADTSQSCPICGKGQPASPRYPGYVFAACAAQAVDEAGRALVYSNVSPGGGLEVRYRDTGEVRVSDQCRVLGVACRAQEARFGGFVLQPVAD